MRTVAHVNLKRIERNFKLMCSAADRHYSDLAGAVPMIKCNAYGHGAEQVARVLARHAQALAFGVATLEEGAALRRAGVRKPIWVFSECAPLTADTVQALRRSKLTPILHSSADLKFWLDRTRSDSGFHLKFNTGLNRLGIDLSELSQVRKLLLSHRVQPEGICSHLADSENSSASITRRQLKSFDAVLSAMASFSASYIHCANSGGIVSEPELLLGRRCNVIRPGLGLYGYSGSRGVRLGLKPALKWTAQVMRTRALERDDAVGYGATFRARRATAQSVLGVGYGDGLKRALSNKTLLVGVRGRLFEAGVLGRVSMDLTSISLRLKPGSWVTLLGESARQGEVMAEAAGTIVYELLTSISGRVAREYAMD